MPSPDTLATPMAWALAYAEIGWHVLPIEPNQKRPLGRLVPQGVNDASADLSEIRSWWMRYPDAGIGIALAKSGLVAIDVDPRNGGTETFDALQADHGSLRSEVMAFTGGGGEHHVFVVPRGQVMHLPGTLGPGVDLKANGYIVVEPSRHPSGKAYAWEAMSNPLDGVAPSPLPDWLRSLQPQLKTTGVQPGSTPIDPVRARDAREALYVLDADDYHEWVQAGMALHSTGWGQSAYAMWCAWAQQSQKFDAGVSAEKWKSFTAPESRENALTLAWVFGQAQKRGWINPAAGGGHLVQIGSPAVEPSGLVLTMEQLDEMAQSVRWAVKGVIPERALGFIYGASGTFKSFIALDYALHRAYGMQWMGRRTRQAVPVYLAAEGGAGLMRRIRAWHKDRGMNWQDCPMRVVVVPLTLRTQAVTLRDAICHAGVTPGDVVIDTMSQTYSGSENSNDEVAEWLRVIGIELRDALACTVTVVHHSGHSATERPRGASAIIANIDFALGVFREEKQMLATVEFAKVKDAEKPADVTFELARMELGWDEDGDTVTSLSARFVMDDEDKARLLQREAAQGRSGQSALLIHIAQPGMTEQELRKLYYEQCGAKDSDGRRQAYYRARKWATQEAKVLEIIDGRVVFGRDTGA